MAHPFIQYLFIGRRISTSLALSGISFVFIVFLFFLISDKENIKLQFPYLWLWIFAQVIFAQGKVLFDGNMGHLSLIYFLHICVFFIFYYSVVLSRIDWKYILKPLGYLCIITSLYSILQHFGIHQFKYDWFKYPGTLGNPTNTAMYIVATSPFLLQYKRGWLYMIVSAIACYFLGSASALLGLLSVIIFCLFVKKYYVRLLLFLSLFTWGIVYKFQNVLNFLNTQDKFYIWSLAIKDWLRSAWVGKGLEFSRGLYSTQTPWRFLHNHYLYIMYSFGIIGLFLLALFLIPIFKKAWKNRQAVMLPFASIIAVAIMSGCSVPMRVYPIILLTGFNLAVLTKGVNNA